MRKNIFFILSSLLLVFISCEKTDSDLVANWKLTKTNYVLTVSQDFTFYDLYGSSWEGDFTINDEKFNSNSFIFYSDNSSGNTDIVSDDIRFMFNGPRLMIIYNYETYFLQEEYIFDVSTGVFKVKGLAENKDGESVYIDLDVSMPRRELKKDNQIIVKEGLPSFPYYMLNFYSSGKLQLDYLTGDIMERLSGKWKTSNNTINIQAKGKSADSYLYQQNDNNMIFTDNNIQFENLPSHLSPFKDKLSSITFQALFEIE